jgi:hypothetical protein
MSRLSPEEFQLRAAELIAEERELYGNEPKTFVLHFLDVDGQRQLGFIFVDAPTFLEAVKKTHDLHINPGGTVRSFVLEGHVLEKDKDRLMSGEEAQSAVRAIH